MDEFIGSVGTAIHDRPIRPHTVIARLKHHYGACEAELARYAAHDPADAAAVLLWCERRLENVVRRAGFVPSRPEARRAVVRGHVLVNGRKVTHPGYLVRAGDVLTVRPRPHIEALYRPRLAGVVGLPGDWLRIEPAALKVTVVRLPAATDVGLRGDL